MRQDGFWLHRNSLPPILVVRWPFSWRIQINHLGAFYCIQNKRMFLLFLWLFHLPWQIVCGQNDFNQKTPNWVVVVMAMRGAYIFTSIWISWLFPDKTLQHIVPPSKSICRVIYLFPIRTFPHKLPSIIQILKSLTIKLNKRGRRLLTA